VPTNVSPAPVVSTGVIFGAGACRRVPAGVKAVGQAQMMLAYGETPSFFLAGRQLGIHHQTVQRCVERTLAYGVSATLGDRPRPGREPTRRRRRLGCARLSARVVDDPAARGGARLQKRERNRKAIHVPANNPVRSDGPRTLENSEVPYLCQRCSRL
jgi:hypothetical protein